MFYMPENHVKIAVAKAGGPTKSAHACGVSNTTIHAWINQARIPNIDHARKLAGMSGLKVEELRPTL